MFQFYGYQLQLIENILQAFNAGYTRPLVVLPMGGGKSRIMAGLLNKLTLQERFINNLAVVPFTNLVEQLTNTFTEMGSVSKCVTYQTASLVKPFKVQALLLDESHHVCGTGLWNTITDKIQADFMCGFTGTPYRSDSCPLLKQNGGVFDCLITGPDMSELIDHKYLANYEYYSYPLVTKTNKTPVVFQYKILGYTESTDYYLPNKENEIIDEYINNFRDMSGIIFCKNVEHAAEISTKFNSVGISSACINYFKSKKTNQQLINDFKTNKYKLLMACNMASEGLDVPHVKLGIMARPIPTSLALFEQQVGRVLRPYQNQTAKILDLVGNVWIWGQPKEAYNRKIY